MWFKGLSTAAVALGSCCSLWGQPRFTGIGFLATAPESAAMGVALDGTVVGLAGTHSSYQFYPIRWTAAGGMQQIGNAIGQANAITPDGHTVVGWKMTAAQHFEGFRWSEQAGLQWLGYLQWWWPDSRAHAVSADGGTVVGTSATTNFHHQAFRWTLSTGLEMLPDLPGISDPGPEALAISADGSVIVGYAYGMAARATRWDEQGVHYLGVLPGATDVHSIAHGISADGQVIVGESVTPAGWPAIEAFRWTAAQGMVGLGVVPNMEASVAKAASEDGSIIIGYVGPVWNANARRAFIWTAADGIRLLREDMLAQGVVGLDGWILREATGICPRGRYIVGRGVNPQGIQEGWVVDYGERLCYANCDASTLVPILNVDDFTCFINEFASAQALPHQQQVEHYANCDGSTAAPALNVDDFTCFINAFAAGCP